MTIADVFDQPVAWVDGRYCFKPTTVRVVIRRAVTVEV